MSSPDSGARAAELPSTIMNQWRNHGLTLSLGLLLLGLAGCRCHPAPGTRLQRCGDEIVVCGQLFHTGAPVVLWMDPDGYDGYRVERRFGSGIVGPSYHVRTNPLTDEEVDRIRHGEWTLDFLREKVDQFVIHYDVAGLSRTCFTVLHDQRNLGVHFMLDLDGTIYQTMDLKECAWHATDANGRSVGVEIANMGAYSINQFAPLQQWYAKDADGRVRITIPQRLGDGGIRTKNFVGRPARNQLISGIVQGGQFRQYDFTPQQYDSLTKLTAALCTVFPKITCDYPRQKRSLGPPTTRPTKGPPGNPTTRPDALAGPDEEGELIPHALPWAQFDNYQGVLGHYHVQTDKIDPGPAFQWDRVIEGARKLMSREAREANAEARGKPARFIPSPPATKPSTRASS
jgi:N-acetylmuramoyl-L-alanine amidase